MGDAGGVGPEIIVAALRERAVYELCRPLVVGHPKIFQKAAALIGSSAQVCVVASPEEARPTPDAINCLSVCSDDVLEVKPGEIDARSGEAAYQSLIVAARLALDRQIDGLVTAPLHKAALWKAGHRYPGHTECWPSCAAFAILQ